MDAFSVWLLCCLFFLGLTVVVILIIIIIFVVRSINFFGTRELHHNKLVVVSLFTMLVSLADVSILFYASTQYVIINAPLTSLILCVVINNGVYYTSIILLYISLLLRLDAIFRSDKKYCISKNSIFMIGSVILIDSIASFYGVFMLYIICQSYVSTSKLNVTHLVEGAVPLVIVVIDGVVINTTLLYMFLNRLYRILQTMDQRFQLLIGDKDKKDTANNRNGNYNYNCVASSKLTVQSTPSSDGDVIDEIQHDNNFINKIDDLDSNEEEQFEISKNQSEQHDIVNLMTKISWLTIVSIVLGQGFNLTLMIADMENVLTYKHLWEKYASVAVLFRCIEAMTNCVVLYFTFVFNTSQYTRCCNLCHQCLKNCCIGYIVRRNIRNMNANR